MYNTVTVTSPTEYTQGSETLWTTNYKPYFKHCEKCLASYCRVINQNLYS